ncbi:hypothetical protein TVAG_485120 [Trichomonas vaginalis G3]|uniref:Mitochondrial carrier protein n=1 Tax=Trichomonas vaginalis (strain ATCC PRA-98 / G3) TaxID=412133 RepID=A2EZ28_TRIV3|nr:hypothetical protein TVAGG3_0754020 [Trichomonas vaginalis G3]EAY02077.1 hypothetical protein TVAG_485120 [Trichomonas vaginalis G3]KAI5512741.1 hypothetical protein TVAGG3_0754020 [Trichomonas vaginalis G3]|eukprot:XP_001330530.1 hypothetical protein [Trichomonas vaginalis G3]
MCSKFCKSMIQTYVSAALGSVVSNAVVRGISGAQTPIDWAGVAIGGLQTGTAFISYPVALKILSDHCESFKKDLESPNGNKAKVYILGGALGAAIIAVVNFPLSKLNQARQGKCEKKGCCACNFAKGMAGTFVDQLGASIGFAATNNTLGPMIPVPHNSFLAYLRANSLVQISNVGGKLLSYPILAYRHGATLPGLLGGYFRTAHGPWITGDACNFFKGVFTCILE